MLNYLKNILKSNTLIFKIFKIFKDYLNLRKNLKNIKGQVVEEDIKLELEKIISNNKVKNIVEIGTWNGLGSTKMIIDLIQTQDKKINFISLEANKLCFKTARKNLKEFTNDVNLLLGRVHDLNDLDYVNKKIIFNYGYGEKEYGWFIRDLKIYKKTNNLVNKLPSSIDILFLDGGEFSTYADFLKLYKRSKYIVLDDTNTFKQDHVLKYITQRHSSFKEIYSSNLRNGLKIYKNFV